MKLKLLTFAVSAACISNLSAGVFTIAGFKFDEKNTVTTAALEGPDLTDHAATKFGRFSEAYVTNPATRENEFAKFNRAKSIGRLLGHVGKGQDYAHYISFPDIKNAPPAPNTERAIIKLGWGEGKGLKNSEGKDFVVFESGNWEGFAVAVQKAGSKDFSAYRYQFPSSKDSIHDANAVAFDLSDFGLADGEMITAIQIKNLFNSKAAVGADKVDDASGQGNIVVAGDAGYDKGFTLRQKPNGDEFPETALSADIVYVTTLHDVEEVKIPEPEPAPAPAPAAPEPAKTNAAPLVKPKK